MKRDWDLIRHIMMLIDDPLTKQRYPCRWINDDILNDTCYVDQSIGETPETNRIISYNVGMLVARGYVMRVYKAMNYVWPYTHALTYQGHDFLARIRDEAVWGMMKTKHYDKEWLMTGYSESALIEAFQRIQEVMRIQKIYPPLLQYSIGK